MGCRDIIGERRGCVRSSTYQMHLLVGLGIFISRIGDFQDAIEIAERGYAVTQRIGGSSVIAAGESTVVGLVLDQVASGQQ
jgi:hypothetical protein